MKSKNRTALYLVAASCLAAGIAQATEDIKPLVGGTGGTPFRKDCDFGSMSGMHGRHATEVDAIAPVCYADLQPYKTPLYGGSGGSYGIRECNIATPATPFVKGIYGRAASRVDQLGLFCTSSLKTSSVSHPSQPFGGSGGNQFSHTCGNGFSVKGLRGRSGSRVDAIGIVCSNRSESSSGS